MDVKRASRKARGISRPATPTEAPTPAAAPTDAAASGKSRWKHDLHRDFARLRLDLSPTQVQVWEIMWDHLSVTNEPFPLSHGTIAREGGIDRTAAARATRQLEGLGLLVCVARGRMGSPVANRWRFPQSLPDIPRRTRRKPPPPPSA